MSDFRKLNSLTKYPSIPTYHLMQDKGRLGASLSFEWPSEPVIATEKVDGTNVRIILTGDDYFIGSREELLYAKGDRIGNPALGIVEGIKTVAEKLAQDKPWQGITVFYGEFYGGKVTAASKQYTGAKATGFRVFDIAHLPVSQVAELMELPVQAISLWRQNDGPKWYGESTLQGMADFYGLQLTPRLGELNLPSTLESAYTLLCDTIRQTKSALDDSGQGKAEGLVTRTKSRSHIAKLRFADYKKTFKSSKTANK